MIDLNDYKRMIVETSHFSIDSSKDKINNRYDILNKTYNDEYLESVIKGTYQFAHKIISISENEYQGYLTINHSVEPKHENINLHLLDGQSSDIIITDSNNNFYSVNLLKEIFGPYFYIEPIHVTSVEQCEEKGDMDIITFSFLYSTFIKCDKMILDIAKNKLIENSFLKKSKHLK